MATWTYPSVLSPSEQAARLVPEHHRAGDWFAAMQVLLAPFCRVDAELAGYVSQLVDRDRARGEALDAIGSWVGEVRGGMPEWEYRRIVLGAIAGSVARETWTWATARGIVVALSGDPNTTIISYGPCEWTATADVTTSLSDEFIRRADAVLARSTRPGWFYSMHLRPAGWLVLDGVPGADVGLASWYVAGTGGA